MNDIRDIWRQYGGEFAGNMFGGALQNDLGDYIRREVYDREWVLLHYVLPNYLGGPTQGTYNVLHGAVVVDSLTSDVVEWAEHRDPMEAVAQAVLRAEIRDAKGELNVQ